MVPNIQVVLAGLESRENPRGLRTWRGLYKLSPGLRKPGEKWESPISSSTSSKH
jgi:hypothetical protein